MQMDNKKIGFLFIIGASVIGVVLLFVFLGMKNNKKEPVRREVNIAADIPEADVEKLPDSKLEAYGRSRNRNIEDYWDQVGQTDAEEEDPLADLNDNKIGGSRSTGVREATYDELFGTASSSASTAKDIEARRAARDAANAQVLAQMQASQMEALQTMMQNSAQSGKDDKAETPVQEEPKAPVAPEREKIDVERVKIVRSGGISSMDDSFSNISSSGISSLDGDDREFAADESYPFKCMFVRQEKLKSAQRVSIRLLEDIVVEGQFVRANTHLNAICTIGDRIDLKVSNIDIGGRILNLDFDAYDNDGTRGIYAPDLSSDTMVEDALKQAGVSAVRRRMSTQVGQAVQDLLSAGSMVITGKGKDRTVIIPAGYQFYLVKHKKNGL